MWHYSIQSLPTGIITNTNCALLPHIFTLTLFAQSGYFLWHFFFLFLQRSRPLTGVLPYAVRTFLSAKNAERQPTDRKQNYDCFVVYFKKHLGLSSSNLLSTLARAFRYNLFCFANANKKVFTLQSRSPSAIYLLSSFTIPKIYKINTKITLCSFKNLIELEKFFN